MRKKDSLLDYRFLPEPDLPQIDISRMGDVINLEEIANSISESEDAIRERLVKQYGIHEEIAYSLSLDNMNVQLKH